MPQHDVHEVFAVVAVSGFTISLNWSQINGGLTALLILSNIILVWWRIRKKKD